MEKDPSINRGEDPSSDEEKQKKRKKKNRIADYLSSKISKWLPEKENNDNSSTVFSKLKEFLVGSDEKKDEKSQSDNEIGSTENPEAEPTQSRLEKVKSYLMDLLRIDRPEKPYETKLSDTEESKSYQDYPVDYSDTKDDFKKTKESYDAFTYQIPQRQLIEKKEKIPQYHTSRNENVENKTSKIFERDKEQSKKIKKLEKITEELDEQLKFNESQTVELEKQVKRFERQSQEQISIEKIQREESITKVIEKTTDQNIAEAIVYDQVQAETMIQKPETVVTQEEATTEQRQVITYERTPAVVEKHELEPKEIIYPTEKIESKKPVEIKEIIEKIEQASDRSVKKVKESLSAGFGTGRVVITKDSLKKSTSFDAKQMASAQKDSVSVTVSSSEIMVIVSLVAIFVISLLLLAIIVIT